MLAFIFPFCQALPKRNNYFLCRCYKDALQKQPFATTQTGSTFTAGVILQSPLDRSYHPPPNQYI